MQFDLAEIEPQLLAWFAKRNWQAFEYQRDVWAAYARGESGLIHAPTGTGKTYAVWLAILAEGLARRVTPQSPAPLTKGRRKHVLTSPPLTALWITPMRALANDTVASLQTAVDALGLDWTVETRTGDTAAAIRRRQKDQLPTTLVTTPESLTLLLSYPGAREKFAHLRAIVVDEWHELLSTKRAVQTELALARLRKWLPGLRTWGLSATLGNLEVARDVLLAGGEGRIVSGALTKSIVVETVLPANVERFPWAGHLGLKLVPQVLDRLTNSKTSLVFTNTRSQAELWYQAILATRPQWEPVVALHHGSLSSVERERVELGLRAGTLKAVVCTASLDLGVDFSPVEQVIQVGSPKGVARLLQRAGRAGHQPGATSRILCVPTHALELVEYSAAREAALAGEIEARAPVQRPLDVLAQHLMTMACGDPFVPEELLAEVRTSYAYRHLSDDEWAWTLDFVARGGKALRAYPQYCKLMDRDGRYYPATPKLEREHRMSIGTITSDAGIQVKFAKGGSLGTIEESFLAKLQPRETFIFAGRALELIAIRDMTAYVRKSSKRATQVPRWMGGRLPLSVELATAVRRRLAEADEGILADDEMRTVAPILALQKEWSRLPAVDQLLIERTSTARTHQWYCYPFEGRLVHEGLGALLAYRLSRMQPASITATVNDYGFELLSPTRIDLAEDDWRRLLSPEGLVDDLQSCLNAAELARRQFREIARIAGLVVVGYPGAARTVRQLQASSGLIFDVFVEYDGGNLLIAQARREVLERQLEATRLLAALRRLAQMRLLMVETQHTSPLAFPLWAGRIQATRVSSEAWGDRIARMALQLEKVAQRSSRTHGRSLPASVAR
jgi:ATP-dependent Lhr-like helicase